MRIINQRKNGILKEVRGFSIEEVVTEGTLMGVRENTKYPGQEIEIYHFKDYVWVVVTAVEPPRFITMYQSRKLKKEFGL